MIATGTPEQVAQVESSFTGQFLRPLLGVPQKPRRTSTSRQASARQQTAP